MQNLYFDVIIIGAGISGKMISKRISMQFPELTVALVDKGAEDATHPFHLHKLIPEMPSLASIRKVKFFQGVYADEGFKNVPSIEDANQYALKVFNKIQITNCHNCRDSEIFVISKSDLLDAFTEKTHVCVSDTISSVDRIAKICRGMKDDYSYKYLINTIPLPIFLKIAEVYSGLSFENTPFYTAKYEFAEPTSLFQMLYNAASGCKISRTTLLDQHLFIEAVGPKYSTKDTSFMYDTYGLVNLPELKPLYPGRFNILPAKERKSLFYWLTEKHDIFCIGRYGAWTHKVANDVWDDTGFICSLIYNKQQVKYYEEIIKGGFDDERNEEIR